MPSYKFHPPLFDRDVNHDGRKFDIRGGEDNRGKCLGREAGERWKRQLKRKSRNLNSSGLMRLILATLWTFRSSFLRFTCNKQSLTRLHVPFPFPIYIYRNFVTMITRCLNHDLIAKLHP